MNFPRARQCVVQPGALPIVDGAKDAGIDRNQGEIRGLDLEKWTALQPVLKSVKLA